MSHWFGLADLGLAFGVVLAILVWQMIDVRKAIRAREAEKAKTAAAPSTGTAGPGPVTASASTRTPPAPSPPQSAATTSLLDP